MDDEEKAWVKKKIVLSLEIIGIIGGLIVLYGAWFTVDAGERAVVLRLGSAVRSVDGGFHFKFPLIEEKVVYEVRTLKEQADATAASKDLQNVTTTVAVNYALDVNDVIAVYKTLGLEYKDRIIDPAIQEAVKASTANYTAEELITKRELVKEDIKEKLVQRLTPNHILVSEVSIVNFSFSSSFNGAIEAKVTAEQNALAQKNKLEQVKYEAEQRVTQAKAEAEAIRIQAQAVTSQGGADYVKLKWVEKWNGVVPQTMLGENSNAFINLK